MKALKITVNGERRVLAGHQDAASFIFSYISTPRGETAYHVSGHLLRKDQEVADYVEWKHEDLNEDDEVTLAVTEAKAVDLPKRQRPTTHDWNPQGELELSCSFCGNIKSDVKYLVKGSNGNICDKCTALAHEIMVDEGVFDGEAKS